MPGMDKLSNYKTTVSEQNGMMTVVYVNTAIVQWNNDKIILNTGGWKSVTTKRKMNQASNQFSLGYGVFQKDYEWFITWKGETIPFDDNEIILER